MSHVHLRRIDETDGVADEPLENGHRSGRLHRVSRGVLGEWRRGKDGLIVLVEDAMHVGHRAHHVGEVLAPPASDERVGDRDGHQRVHLGGLRCGLTTLCNHLVGDAHPVESWRPGRHWVVGPEQGDLLLLGRQRRDRVVELLCHCPERRARPFGVRGGRRCGALVTTADHERSQLTPERCGGLHRIEHRQRGRLGFFRTVGEDPPLPGAIELHRRVRIRRTHQIRLPRDHQRHILVRRRGVHPLVTPHRRRPHLAELGVEAVGGGPREDRGTECTAVRERRVAHLGAHARRNSRGDLRLGQRVDRPAGAREAVAEQRVEHHPLHLGGSDRTVNRFSRNRQWRQSIQLAAERDQCGRRVSSVPLIERHASVGRDPRRHRRPEPLRSHERERGAHPLRDHLRIGGRGGGAAGAGERDDEDDDGDETERSHWYAAGEGNRSG